ncbi:hypothetical protein YC2023_005072 [Brassica napus]
MGVPGIRGNEENLTVPWSSSLVENNNRVLRILKSGYRNVPGLVGGQTDRLRPSPCIHLYIFLFKILYRLRIMQDEHQTWLAPNVIRICSCRSPMNV